MTPRRFIVTVGESPPRVVVEDVRGRRRAAAAGLGAVGAAIDRMLDASRQDGSGSHPAGTDERDADGDRSTQP